MIVDRARLIRSGFFAKNEVDSTNIEPFSKPAYFRGAAALAP